MSAATARRRRHAERPPLAIVLDYGPDVRLARGDVAVADAADPDAPNRTVRRARVVVHYEAMSLTEHQREAADRLCVQAERAGGAAWRPDAVVTALHPSQRGHPAEWQLVAIRDVQDAREALGEIAWRLLWDAVVLNTRLADMTGGSHGRAVLTGRLLAALDRLAEHWRLT